MNVYMCMPLVILALSKLNKNRLLSTSGVRFYRITRTLWGETAVSTCRFQLLKLINMYFLLRIAFKFELL